MRNRRALGERPGAPSSHAVRLWLEFIAAPTAGHWYRAHNASIVDAYLVHRRLADADWVRAQAL